jgi:sugar phosphate isomerase/epimerase
VDVSNKLHGAVSFRIGSKFDPLKPDYFVVWPCATINHPEKGGKGFSMGAMEAKLVGQVELIPLINCRRPLGRTKMINHATKERLAVCSWSLQPATPADLVLKTQATGLRRVQLALDPLREAPAEWGLTAKVFRQHSLTIVSGMFGCVGEDYSSLETIRRTGGLAPDETWEQNLKNVEATALLAWQLGLGFVSFHAGFLPHDPSEAAYGKMVQRLATVADIFALHQIGLGLETGQETAPQLLRLLETLGRPLLGVNFDPANMILYDKGNPVEALRTLGPWIRQVHIKDATRTKTPGTWGEEVAVGTGEVDWPAFFSTLEEVHFRGNLVIEREAGTQRVEDICTARELIEKTLL